MTGMYGEGYPGNASPPGGIFPTSVRIQVACGPGNSFVDVSSVVDRLSYQQRKDEATGTIVADFDIYAFTGLIGGVAYDIKPWQEVRVDCPYETDQTKPYMRWFMGYVMIPGDAPEGAEKKYHLTCTSVNRDFQNPTKQIVTQYPPGDGTPIVRASPLTPVSAGINVSFRVGSTTSLLNIYGPYTDGHGNAIHGREMVAQNWDGTNREIITCISVDRSDPNNLLVYANFTSSKSLQVPSGGGTASWSLSGGISAADLWRDGWSSVDSAGTRTEYEGIIDHYYNYAGKQTITASLSAGVRTVTPPSMEFLVVGRVVTCADGNPAHTENVTISSVTSTTWTATFTQPKSANWTALVGVANLPVGKGAMHDTLVDLIHTRFAGTSPAQAWQQMLEQNPAPAQYRHTVTTSIAAGLRTITPDSMTGIANGAIINCANANGTNTERVMVRSVSGGTFQANFLYSKTGDGTVPWIINTGSAPYAYFTWSRDSPDHTAPWTRECAMYDLFDVSIQTPIALTDITVIDPTTQTHYSTGIQHTLDGTNQGSWQDVIGNSELGAAGSFEDTAVTNSIGRIVALEPINRNELQTNADCNWAGQTQISLFGKARDTIQQVRTLSLLDANQWLQASTVSFKNTLGVTAIYFIADRSVSFASGVPESVFTLGDRLPMMGDKAPPAYGAQVAGAITRPAAPRWVGAADPTGWVPFNSYYPYEHATHITVEATLSGELNLRRVGFEYKVGTGGWSHVQYVTVTGGTTSAQFTTAGVPPGATVQFRATAWDNLNPPHASDPSSLGSVVASAVVNPVAPTATGEASNRYNGATGETDVLESFTPATQPPGINVVSYQATVTPTGSYTRFFYGCTGSPYPLLNLPPGVSCNLLLFAVTDDGFISGPSATRTFTTAASPASRTLDNPDFSFLSEFDATKPDRWVETSQNNAASTLDSSGAALIKGTNSLKQHVGNSTLPLDKTTELSAPVACFDPATSAFIDTMHVQAVYKTSAATGDFAAFVRWYSDALGTLQIGGDVIPTTGGTWSGTPHAGKTVLNTTIVPPSGALTVRMGLRYQSTGTANDLFWGGCALEQAVTAGSLAGVLAPINDSSGNLIFDSDINLIFVEVDF